MPHRKESRHVPESTTVRMGWPVYVGLTGFLVPLTWAVGLGISNYLSIGYLRRQDNDGFVPLLAFLFFVVFLMSRVYPAYRVVISDDEIEMTYRVSIFGFTLFDLSPGKATWKDVTHLGYFDIGFQWGLALHFEANGKERTVLLNWFFTNTENALRIALKNLPSYKITREARRKLEKKGLIEAA